MSRYWYYISGKKLDGKTAFDGKFDNEKEANDKGLLLFTGRMFDIHKYQTSDLSVAKSMWKHEDSEKHGVDIGMRRLFKPKEGHGVNSNRNVVVIE